MLDFSQRLTRACCYHRITVVRHVGISRASLVTFEALWVFMVLFSVLNYFRVEKHVGYSVMFVVVISNCIKYDLLCMCMLMLLHEALSH